MYVQFQFLPVKQLHYCGSPMERSRSLAVSRDDRAADRAENDVRGELNPTFVPRLSQMAREAERHPKSSVRAGPILARKRNACTVQSASGTNWRFAFAGAPAIADFWKFGPFGTSGARVCQASRFFTVFPVYAAVYSPFTNRFSRFFTVFTVSAEGGMK
jgi:hypothetical protein